MEDMHEIIVCWAFQLTGRIYLLKSFMQARLTNATPLLTHSSNHWSTGVTMFQYIDAGLIPHMVKKRAKLDLPPNSYDTCIWDVFAAHWCELCSLL